MPRPYEGAVFGGRACLARSRYGVGAGHARPEALKNKSDGRGSACKVGEYVVEV
jgi:hypothetical protein